MFEQFGTVNEINLVRDKDTGKVRGFAFLKYADQRSSILAVDNFNGIMLEHRSIVVDHVLKYRTPEELEQERRAHNAKDKKFDYYAGLLSEELFLSGTGEFRLETEEDSNAVESSTSAGECKGGPILIKGKRLRTAEEKALRDQFMRGELTKNDYQEKKRRIKKNISSKQLKNKNSDKLS